jgi:hypothetical protein
MRGVLEDEGEANSTYHHLETLLLLASVVGVVGGVELPIQMLDVILFLEDLIFGLEELVVEDCLRELREQSRLGWEHYQTLIRDEPRNRAESL